MAEQCQWVSGLSHVFILPSLAGRPLSSWALPHDCKMTASPPALRQLPWQEENGRAKQKGVVPVLEKPRLALWSQQGFAGYPSLSQSIQEGEWFSQTPCYSEQDGHAWW